jgi:glyoxylase-like metal-dependent hydrolase (beta-lactamase superfamily II)
MRVHAITTGSVTVRSRQVRGSGPGPIRQLGPMIDREWVGPLPIWTWAIEHPEGVIVVDTGDTARTSEPGYFPRWHPYFRRAVRLDVKPHEEIGPQLAGLGIEIPDVRRVVVTHMHTDHIGGVHHFEGREILVTPKELATASGLSGRINGFLPQHLPDWFAPREIELVDEPFGPFERSMPLTDAGDVRVVPTPGHTPGHVSVVVDEGDRVLFLAGDTSYTEALMLEGAVDGVSPNPKAARDSMERIAELCRRRPTVYLPTHDEESAKRLEERRPASA